MVRTRRRERLKNADGVMVNGYTSRIKDERRQGTKDRERGRNKSKEEDRNNNSLVLWQYSDKFSSCLGCCAPAGAGAGPDDKPPPPSTAALAIYDPRILCEQAKKPAGSRVVLRWCRHFWKPLTTSDGLIAFHLAVVSSHYLRITGVNSVLLSILYQST